MGSGPRMTAQTLALLSAMLSRPDEWRYGLELSKDARLPPGSIYAILARLLGSGILERVWEEIDPSEEGRPRRRLYRLTPEGEAVARREIDAHLAMLQRSTPGSPRPKVRPA
jgi:PadR family transcriptional regulator, regulatory protein PadR